MCSSLACLSFGYTMVHMQTIFVNQDCIIRSIPVTSAGVQTTESKTSVPDTHHLRSHQLTQEGTMAKGGA